MRSIESIVRKALVVTTIASGLAGCAPRLDNGGEATVTRDTNCLQCPASYSKQDCLIQENYGTVPAGTKVTAEDNKYGFHQDGNWVRVDPHYLEGQNGALISHEDVCWVDGSDLKK